MKAVYRSIKPYWLYLILIGYKTVEVSKTFPKADDWNKEVFLNCSKDMKSFKRIPEKDREWMRKYLGKCACRFVCDSIEEIEYQPHYYIGRLGTQLSNPEMWEYTDRDNNEWGSISSEYGVRYFKITGGVEWTDEDWQPHYFPGVPATEYVENSEKQGLFEPVLSLINAYNKAISEKANDVDYFADAYLKILGVTLDAEGVKHIRDNRIINFEGENAEKLIVEFLGKPESDTTQENLLNRTERLIFQISMVANISDENFGAATGIALKYKLQAMSNLEKTKERKFTSGMNRRYKLLFGHPSSKVQKDAWVELHYRFTPNIPANLLEEAQIAAQMEGITSHETQLKVLSVVDDVEGELEKIEEENAAPEETIVDQLMFGKTDKQIAADVDQMAGKVNDNETQ